MAPKGMKRPAAAPAGARSKKPAVDPSVAKCKLVAEALAESPLAKSVKTMLSQVVPNSLGIYADERHAYQKSLVEMIGEALGGVCDSLSATKVAALAKVEGADADKAARDAAAVAAEEALAAAIAGVAEAKAASIASDAALAVAKKALKEAEFAQKSGDQEFAQAGVNRDALDAAQTKLHSMNEAAGTSGDVKEVLAVAKNNGCDENLVTTLPDVLKKETSARGTFDGLAFQQLVEFFAEKVDSEATSLAEGENLKGQRTEAVAAAGTALGAATNNIASGKDALSKAMAAEKEAQAALKVAKAAVRSSTSEASAATKELKEATGALDSFAKGALAAYKELKERAAAQAKEPEATPPPDKPAPPAPEAPPALEALAAEPTKEDAAA